MAGYSSVQDAFPQIWIHTLIIFSLYTLINITIHGIHDKLFRIVRGYLSVVKASTNERPEIIC